MSEGTVTLWRVVKKDGAWVLVSVEAEHDGDNYFVSAEDETALRGDKPRFMPQEGNRPYVPGWWVEDELEGFYLTREDALRRFHDVRLAAAEIQATQAEAARRAAAWAEAARGAPPP